MEFIDLKAQYFNLKEKIDHAIHNSLNNCRFILGEEVISLENQLKEYVGVKHCVTCANGTDALQLLYMAYGVGIGDVVFCPDITFFASIEPACLLGATPVFCDIDDSTYNISAKSLEMQIKAVIKEGKYTPKVVVCVDFLGNPVNYDEINSICDKYNLLLIEDAAQSFGASYGGKRTGSFGNSAITSFFPAKPLGCYGDGGAIFTNDEKTAEICRSLRSHGKLKDQKYNNQFVGINSRLDTLQAAILLVKLKAYINYELESRERIANTYSKAFESYFAVPKIAKDSTSVFAQYALLAKDKMERDKILNALNQKDIPNMIYYPIPLHKVEVFKNKKHYDETFENSIWYCDRTFSIPMHPYLEKNDQDMIIETILSEVSK